VLHVEIRRRVHLMPVGQPHGELDVELLATGEPCFLQVSRGLDSRVALQRRAELVNDSASEPEARWC
jgi:hypothetical protein